MATIIFFILLVVLLFLAPEYLIYGVMGLVASLFAWLLAAKDPMALSFDMVVIILWGFEAVGFVFAGVKFYHKKRERDWERARLAREDEHEKAERIQELDNERRERENIRVERRLAENVYEELVGKFVQMVSVCAKPAIGMRRALVAFSHNLKAQSLIEKADNAVDNIRYRIQSKKERAESDAFLEAQIFGAGNAPEQGVERSYDEDDIELMAANWLLIRDVLQIMAVIAHANGTVPRELARLCQPIWGRLEPDVFVSEREVVEAIDRWCKERYSVDVPVMLSLLQYYDEVQGTQLACDAADTYRSLIISVSECCEQSASVKLVIAKYEATLRPYLQQRTHATNPHENRNDSRADAPSKSLNAVAGMSTLKKQLMEEVVEVFRAPDKYRKYGISIPNGILLFGPPGCGKTYIARQLAAELGYNYFEIAPSDVGSSYLHGTALKIREAFDEAAKKAPSVLFIDEFEALVPTRDSGHQYKAEEVNEFLTRMDGCSDRHVLLIAATNQPWNIDSAVQRAGRLDKKIYVAPPDLTARGEILAHHLNGRYTSPDLDTGMVASSLSGYSSSDLKLLVEEAAKLAFKADEPISEKHFADVIKIVLPSISSEEETRYQQFTARGTNSFRTPAPLGFHN